MAPILMQTLRVKGSLCEVLNLESLEQLRWKYKNQNSVVNGISIIEENN